MDPHTAVAWRALKKYRSRVKGSPSGLEGSRPGSKTRQGGENASPVGLVLSTAHPAKFPHVFDGELSRSLAVPEPLHALRPEMKHSVRLPADFERFKEFLLQS
jgi:threonine synthase